jgi:hypothetical protein
MQDIRPTIDYIGKMNGFISNENTGNTEEFAAKMKVCRRTMAYDIAFYNELIDPYGAFVFYNEKIASYQYAKPGNFRIIIEWIPFAPIPGFIMPNYYYTA